MFYKSKHEVIPAVFYLGISRKMQWAKYLWWTIRSRSPIVTVYIYIIRSI